jgi:hypothetical protein
MPYKLSLRHNRFESLSAAALPSIHSRSFVIEYLTDDIDCARLRSPSRKHHRGVDLVSDALPFGRLWYGEPNAVSNAIGYAKFYSQSHDAVIR